MHRLRATYLFAAAAALIVWSVGCSVFYRHLTDRWNHAQLSEMTSQALERAERALDLVVLTQTEVLIAGLALCGPEAVEQLRRSKYGVGHVADMYLVEPGVRARHCSAGGAFSASLPPATVRSAWPTGSNPDLRMGTFEGRDGPVLGVEWRPGGARSIIAAIDADALLFDVLPGALRERAGLALKIEGGDVFARFALTSGGAANEAGWTEFTSESVRYPISAELRVAPDALADWRAQPGEMTIAVAILVGLLVSLLCAEAIHRRIDPKSEAIDKALAKGEITPYFQPIVDLETGRLIGGEALARWILPDGSRVSPAEFIPIIERSGRSDRLLRAQLQHTGATLGPALAARPDMRISFNVTPEQYCAPGFVDRLLADLAAAKLSTHNITLEMTERQALARPDAAAETAARLTAAGVRTAIDDAGTGHNGLAAMQTLQADCLKIDKYFIDGVVDERRSRLMVEMLTSIAREFGMSVVAEGVETGAQATTLRRLGVGAAQGWLFSAAQPAERFAAMIDERLLAVEELPESAIEAA